MSSANKVIHGDDSSLVARLSLEQKVRLLTGADGWNLYAEKALGLRPIVMSDQVPDAPLLYGADWNVFSSAKYTGWPNQSHPYMNPSPSDPQMPYILMQLKPVS